MPTTNNAKIEVKLPAALAAAAKRQAAKQHRPLSQVVRELLAAWLAKA